MNQIKSFYTTVSNGSTHIAADTKYIGSVESYNNFFTRAVASLFAKSIQVNFDGKIRSVNKTSYSDFLRSLNIAQSDDVVKYKNFRSVVQNCELPTGEVKMRDVIAKEDREGLFRRLAQAISSGDTTKALLMIGKGAEVDTLYFERQGFAPSFVFDTDGLSSNARYEFDVFHAPPILQAVKKSNVVVLNFLKEAGANQSAMGKEYRFKREITDVTKKLELAIKPEWVRDNRYEWDEKQKKMKEKTDYKIQYKPELQERVTVHTQDMRSASRTYRLEPAIAG